MPVEYFHIIDHDIPRGGTFHVIEKHWWLIDDFGRPLVSAKYGTPQCNKSEHVTRRLARGRAVAFFEIVFMPIEAHDWSYACN